MSCEVCWLHVSNSIPSFLPFLDSPLALLGISPSSVHQCAGVYLLYSCYHAYRHLDHITFEHFKSTCRGEAILDKIVRSVPPLSVAFGVTEVLAVPARCRR